MGNGINFDSAWDKLIEAATLGLNYDLTKQKQKLESTAPVTPVVSGVGINSTSSYEDYVAQNGKMIAVIGGAVVLFLGVIVWRVVK